MKTFVDHMSRDKHAAALCVISGTGALYFFVSVCQWTWLFWLLGHVFWGLSGAHFIKQAVLPVAECLALFASFLFAFTFCWCRKRGMELTIFGCVGIATAAFLFDTHFSRAQIHVFGPPGTNHYYANWWLYSCGPHLAPSIRYPLALMVVSTIAGVIWFSKSKFSFGAELEDNR